MLAWIQRILKRAAPAPAIPPRAPRTWDFRERVWGHALTIDAVGEDGKTARGHGHGPAFRPIEGEDPHADLEALRAYGAEIFMNRQMEAGDFMIVQQKGQPAVRARITLIEYSSNPTDMFFAEMEMIGEYEAAAV